MPAATLSQVFGANASISSGTLTVSLADFTDVGLTPTSTSPTEILTAILLKLKANTPTDAATNDKDWGITIGDPFISVVRDNEQLDTQYPVSIYRPFANPTLDPDDVIG
ncbi:hypothetical protein ACQ4N7_01210 [Nodosilinea sp. AN01ver1]|uniref:hypothetical protein n=1 Tax=Nodosilinea sp. AN01ver1 TaxID=3423362 RepID=UPI003D31B144